MTKMTNVTTGRQYSTICQLSHSTDDMVFSSTSDLSRLRRERQLEIDDDLWDRRKEEEEIELARRKAEEEVARANEPRQPLIQPLKLQKTKPEQPQQQGAAARPSIPFPPIKVEPAPPIEKEPGMESPTGELYKECLQTNIAAFCQYGHLNYYLRSK